MTQCSEFEMHKVLLLSGGWCLESERPCYSIDLLCVFRKDTSQSLNFSIILPGANNIYPLHGGVARLN